MRYVMSIALLCTLCVADADAQPSDPVPTPNIILPYDADIRGADGSPDYVDDATVQAKVPWLKNSGPRLSRCFQSMTIPEHIWIVYPPRIVGAHKVTTNSLNCEHERDSDHFACDANDVHRPALFDVNPNQYFSTDGVAEDDAVPLIHAVLTGQLKFIDGVENPHLQTKQGDVGDISASEHGFQIRYGDCGCSGRMLIERDKAGSYVVTKAGFEMCI